MELAHTYLKKDNKVTIIDMLESHPDAASGALDYLLAAGYAAGAGADIRMGQKLSAVEPGVVISEHVNDGGQTKIPADAVILCMGYKSNDELYESLKTQFPRVWNIGDSAQVGKIRLAVQAGFDAAAGLD
jgi:2-enoate reductase